MQKKTDLELVLEFCVELSRRMILSGANLERVQLAVASICHAYGYSEISLFLLNTNVSLSVMADDGSYASRQCTIPPAGIHLAELRALNSLSYRVVSQTPEPSLLRQMIIDAYREKQSPDWLILLGQLMALEGLCVIFGGNLPELLCVALVTVVMHYGMILAAKPGLDRLVTNALVMWLATVTVILLIHAGFSANAPVILVTVSLLVIPGIPLVNAVRNLLCGNEMNGLLQLAKVTVETLALAMGITLALKMFGMDENMKNAVVAARSSPLALIPFSFLASVGFGVMFRIPGRDLWLAGLGGALTRAALLLFAAVFPSRLLFVTAAALVSALYSECLATCFRVPSTYFIYPSIIPLIPGDLFYYALVGIYLGNAQMFSANAADCLLNLLGMSIGFVLSSIIAHYIRKMRFSRLVNQIRLK